MPEPTADSQAPNLLVVLGLIGALVSGAAGEVVIAVDVTDAAGVAVADAEVFLLQQDLPLSAGWTSADADGRVAVHTEHLMDAETPAGQTLLVVRAPGKAWHVERVELPHEPVVTLALEHGRAVEIVLTSDDRRRIPDDLVPIVYVPGQSVAAWLSGVQREPAGDVDSVFSTAVVEPRGDGRFGLVVPEACPPLYVVVNHPGFLRAFQAGPFDADDLADWSIDVALPSPIWIEVGLAPRQGVAPTYEACCADISVVPEIPDSGWSFTVAVQDHEGSAFKALFNDLAPAGYSVRGYTGTRAQRHQSGRDDFFADQAYLEVPAGEVGVTSFELETYDETRLRAEMKGEQILDIEILRSDGTPAAGRSYDVGIELRKFGRTLSVASGVVPDDGMIPLEELPAAPMSVLKLEVDGAYLGRAIVRSKPERQREQFRLAPAVGDAAPDVTLTALDDGSTFTLSSLRGQVVLLEFWASWCGPCQEPMRHNDQIMAERADSWAGRAVIIGASIDGDIETIRAHVDKRGWTNVRQTFCGEGAWQSDAAKAYAVNAVPSAFLIDASGVIVWTGHPADLEVETRVDAILAETGD